MCERVTLSVKWLMCQGVPKWAYNVFDAEFCGFRFGVGGRSFGIRAFPRYFFKPGVFGSATGFLDIGFRLRAIAKGYLANSLYVVKTILTLLNC